MQEFQKRVDGYGIQFSFTPSLPLWGRVPLVLALRDSLSRRERAGVRENCSRDIQAGLKVSKSSRLASGFGSS
jgi:hypothetical protein